MYGKALTTYYVLSAAIVIAGFFFIQPTNVPEVKNFQQDVQHRISVAWQQTIGDGPWFDDVTFVYDSVESFYQQSADATIALFESRDSDADIAYVFGTAYKNVADIFHSHSITPKVAGAATESPMATKTFIDSVPAANPTLPANMPTPLSQPVNSEATPWVTVQDNLTGQLYCVALYDGNVNKYLGPCQSDYH